MSEREAAEHGLFLKHYAAGKQAFEEGRLAEAALELEEACLLRPRDNKILNLLGLLYFKQEKFEKAEEVYRKLAAGSPEVHTLFYNLGLIYLKLNRLDDAEAAFAKALELSRENPKINFYLGSIYEKQRRFQDAIFQYRQAGANILVRRVEDKLQPEWQRADDNDPGQDLGAESLLPKLDVPSFAPAKTLGPISDVLLAEAAPRPPEATPPAAESPLPSILSSAQPPRTLAPRPPARAPLQEPRASATDQRAPQPPGGGHEPGSALPARRSTDIVSFLAGMPAPAPSERTGNSGATPRPGSFPTHSADRTTPPPPGPVEPFRLLQRNLLECSFAGKLFVKQGTIYSYTGNLTFWVKEKRRAGTPALVIVTGNGKVLLTDRDREIKVSRVEGPVALRPFALLACQETLTPRYFTIGIDPAAPEFLSLEGNGLIALSVASRLLTLTVTPDQPVAVATNAIVMWAGELQPHLVRDDTLQEALVSQGAAPAPLIRLEGTGRVLMEQTV